MALMGYQFVKDMTSLIVKFLGMRALATRQLAEPGDICVNPLSWRISEEIVGAQRNLGSVSFASEENRA